MSSALSITSTSLKDFPPRHAVSLFTRVASFFRVLYVFSIKENAILWSWMLQGRRNPRADMEGPFYVIGSPSCQISDGKAIMATKEQLKEFVPFLFTISVRTPKGEPVPYAAIDWWQADTAGNYYLDSYNLRGKFITDADGNAELLTVPPGKYGPANHMRAGHFHFMVWDEARKWEALTTQAYVCKENDEKEMGTDFINYVRSPRPANMLQCWYIPSANRGEPYMEFYPVSSEDPIQEKVKWWNEQLAEYDPDLKIVAGGHTDIKLNAPPSWFGI